MNTPLRERIDNHNQYILQHKIWLAYNMAKKQVRVVVPDGPSFEFVIGQLGHVTGHFSASRVPGFSGRIYHWGGIGLSTDTDTTMVMKEEIFSVPGDNRECVITLAYWLEDRNDTESATWIRENFQDYFEPPQNPRKGIFRRRK